MIDHYQAAEKLLSKIGQQPATTEGDIPRLIQALAHAVLAVAGNIS
jgi:hypothetical protein